MRVAEILLAAYALDKTIDALLALFGGAVGEQAIRAALGLANHAVRARPVLAPHGITRRVEHAEARLTIRLVADEDTYYRAAYVRNAARRIQDDLDRGVNFREAQRREQRHYEAHRRARDKRLNAAAEVAKAQLVFGRTLGWYRNWALDSDADCIAADGCNFDPLHPPIIGFPGSVHPECGCSPGPPHEGEDVRTVNEAVASLGTLRPIATTRRPNVRADRRRAG